jgi:hypothetical protein
MKKSEPIDGRAILRVLDERLAQLAKRRRVVTEEIVNLEKSGASWDADGNASVEQAEQLLDGGRFIAPRDKLPSRLAALHAERDTIDRALHIGGSRQLRLAAERTGEIYAAHFPAISKIETRRVMLALELQAVNRDREAFRMKLSEAGGGNLLPTDGVDLLGLGDVHDEVSWAGNRLIADGIEIEKARDG